jgi:hypothetical protein
MVYVIQVCRQLSSRIILVWYYYKEIKICSQAVHVQVILNIYFYCL